ncbi:hypothetical protein GobsT_48660 [Gemmata obscuriglobus]|uniref:Uncharacterized protein n=1 Tax=Gemmata obscuriglobus TaxID=114 RepID=A0A2Z3H231_9BACT|nr:hypothetical protein [Gemmata obscuriglobus]AWM37195.1 hypothetical protein C1280_09275 [Gemmata obscuriglobus]QEG30066.1 hypothetical protein GobsT_48660 [Gemmata obscuriglobus]VTS09387.1 Uncharacterized protein OS=Singulisphaera acidiphila (strain ATCC BAA-1392 / DSM 18658 / VKM B-2454 / MOB10) GN=Sinac_4933 PE=4 SV=1 [Gemmata obscuriglobus UQM 2246]
MRRVLLSALAGIGVATASSLAQERVVPSVIAAGGPFKHSRPATVPCPPLGVGPLTPGAPSIPTAPSEPVPQMDPPVAPPGGMPSLPPDRPPVMPYPSPPNPLERRLVDPFAQATEAGGLAPRTFNENFDGDFGGVYYSRRITTGFTTVPRVVGFTQRVTGFTPTTTSTTTTGTTTDPQGGRTTTTTITNTTTLTPVIVNDPVIVSDRVAQTRLVRLTLASRYSGVLITDNDNPRPQDRFYGGFNFYDDIGGKLNPGLGQVDLQRQLVGFEKVFLGGDASFGMRLPFQQQYGPSELGSSHTIGDLTLLFKYAFVNDAQTGNVVSAGLALTVPTGSGDVILADGSQAPHSVLFQPWLGFVRVMDRAFFQGITSLVVPTDGRDPTLFNNSVGMGYYLYRAPDAWLTSIAPMVEFHVRTPLSGRNPAGLVYLQDQVNITSGLHFRFNRATLSASMCIPVAGPRPWAFEAMTFFNYNF